MAETTEVAEKEQFVLAVLCEVCGQPLEILRLKAEEWWARCSDADCAVLHRGSF